MKRFLWFSLALCLAIGPLEVSAQTPTPVPTASPAPTKAESAEDFSTQRAASERSKMYQAGLAYSRWLDHVAQNSGNAFLSRRPIDRVTWMRLLACVGALVVLAVLTGWFLWFVRRRAGAIESNEVQSWPALAAAAIRKPLALLVWVIGGFLAFMPLVAGISSRPHRLFFANALTALLYAGRVIAILWLILQGIRAIEKRMRHWAQSTDSVVNNVVVPVAGQTLRLAVPLIAVILLLPLLKLPEDWAWLTQKGFGILLIVSLAFLIIRGVRAVQVALLREHRLDVPDNYTARRIFTQVSVIRKIIITVVVIVGIGSILMMFDTVRQLGTSILASAGIAGIILGLAAQKTLGNLLAGIQIALSQPILIDDVVIVEGEFGRIEDITLTFVTVRTWDLRRLVVPITYFIEKPFQNWSRKSDEILGAIYLYLDYQVPLGELREELKRLVEGNDKWDRKVCGLLVTDTKPNTIEVRAVVSSLNAGINFDLRCQVREGLIEFLRDRYPSSLPQVRMTLHRPEEQSPVERRHGVEGAGREHEQGSSAPGLKPEKDDGAAGRN
ncbi:MAG: mechanosensitive ion channel family protein [Chthoniobacterales bacterium]